VSLADEFPNFDEAATGPSSHQCGGEIVEVYTHSGEIALACFWCFIWWSTGLKEAHKGAFIGHATLVAAADALYPVGEQRRQHDRPACTRCGRRNVELAWRSKWCKHCKAAYANSLEEKKRAAA
jgi:hypothetical protein